MAGHSRRRAMLAAQAAAEAAKAQAVAAGVPQDAPQLPAGGERGEPTERGAGVGVPIVPSVDTVDYVGECGDTSQCSRDPARAMPARINGRFAPGQSGNPGGRIGMPVGIKTALKKGSEAAVKTLLALATNESGNVPERVQCDAAIAIMDRVFGKAVQPIDADIQGTLGHIVVELRGDLEKFAR